MHLVPVFIVDSVTVESSSGFNTGTKNVHLFPCPTADSITAKCAFVSASGFIFQCRFSYSRVCPRFLTFSYYNTGTEKSASVSLSNCRSCYSQVCSYFWCFFMQFFWFFCLISLECDYRHIRRSLVRWHLVIYHKLNISIFWIDSLVHDWNRPLDVF